MRESLRRYSLLILLLLMSPLFYYFYQKQQASKALDFALCAGCAQRYEVEEKGTLRYTGGKTISIANAYQLENSIAEVDGRLSISGIRTGRIDPQLEPLVSRETWTVSLNRSDPADFCPKQLSVIYPAMLRRLIYFMPDSARQPGARWVTRFCKGTLECSYQLDISDTAIPLLNVECLGYIEDTSVEISAAAGFLPDRHIFKTLHISSSLHNAVIDAEWVFSEQVLSPEPVRSNN